MKHFGIFGRRFLSSNRSSLSRTLTLLSTSAAASYLTYHYLHQQHHQHNLFPWTPVAEASPKTVDPYTRSRQGIKMERHEEAVIVGATGSSPELAKAVA